MNNKSVLMLKMIRKRGDIDGISIVNGSLGEENLHRVKKFWF